VHIITQSRLREFAKKHSAADVPLRVWEAMMRQKKYKTPHEVKADFGASVDFIGGGKTVFDCGGNKYRIVVKMLCKRGWVLIRHVLTHKEYDKHIRAGTL
jgi:mRNA interferase HigB